MWVTYFVTERPGFYKLIIIRGNLESTTPPHLLDLILILAPQKIINNATPKYLAFYMSYNLKGRPLIIWGGVNKKNIHLRQLRKKYWSKVIRKKNQSAWWCNLHSTAVPASFCIEWHQLRWAQKSYHRVSEKNPFAKIGTIPLSKPRYSCWIVDPCTAFRSQTEKSHARDGLILMGLVC